MVKKKIEIYATQRSWRINLPLCKKFACMIIEGEGYKHKAEIRIIISSDAEVGELNRRYLHHNHLTDVITFPLSEGEDELEGEVYISLERAAEHAEKYGVSLENELCRLIAHGILHLLGFRDGTESGREEMRRREDYYLGKFPLISTEG